MRATIIFYDMTELIPKNKEKLVTKLFGKEQMSYYGKYKYRTGGVLDGIPHLKPVRSALIVKKTDKNKVLKVLNQYKAIHCTYDTIIKKEAIEPRIIY